MKTLTLTLDDLDYEAITRAVKLRLNENLKHEDGSPIMPDNESDETGAAVAEVCRGWMEMLGHPIREDI